MTDFLASGSAADANTGEGKSPHFRTNELPVGAIRRAFLIVIIPEA